MYLCPAQARSPVAEFFRRIAHDVRHLRNIDAYAVALVAFVFAALSVAGDALPANPRWAVLLVGIALLVFRMTLPERYDGSADKLLLDRSAFEATPFPARLRSARELWVFAPTGINLLSPQTCDIIRTTLLDSPEGVVRVAVLDPDALTSVEYATRQLDDSLDYPPQLFLSSLQATIRQLRRLTSVRSRGSFAYRLLNFSPGFSLVAIDPGKRHGVLIVEFHGFHNELTSTRMHIELTRDSSEQWYEYWLGQFDRIWRAATDPA
jgi:hypothetical protein